MSAVKAPCHISWPPNQNLWAERRVHRPGMAQEEGEPGGAGDQNWESGDK
jgi:hypothetical protein